MQRRDLALCSFLSNPIVRSKLLDLLSRVSKKLWPRPVILSESSMFEFLRSHSNRCADADAKQSSMPIASQLQFVLDNMAEGVIVCDCDSRVVKFNRGANVILDADLTSEDLGSMATKYQALSHLPKVRFEVRIIAPRS
jgi:hypothetical protein